MNNIVILLILFTYWCIMNISCDNIEPMIINNDNSFKESDKKFIPYASKGYKLSNNYYSIPNKCYKKTGGLLDTLIREDPNYSNYLKDFPYDDPNIENDYKLESKETFLSQFQDIVLDEHGDKMNKKKYKLNNKKDELMIYDPLDSTYYIDMELDIITDC